MANYVSNTDFINYKSYIYDKLHTFIVPIAQSENKIFNTTTIPLEKFGLIKDFVFTISDKHDYITENINKFKDDLIELEILCKYNNELILHTRLDSVMMNSYIPLKKLGHILPSGMYYYGFSSGLSENRILGSGLWGKNYFLRIKTNKSDIVAKFYITEYFEQLFK